MKQLTHYFLAKAIAVLLFITAAIVFVFGFFAVFYMYDYHFYEASPAAAKERIYSNITRDYANEAYYDYFYAQEENTYAIQEYQERFSPDKTNFLFTLKNKAGKILLSTFDNQKVQFSDTHTYYEGGYWVQGSNGTDIYVEDDSYTLDCYVRETFTAEDRYVAAENWIQSAYSMRYTVIVITISSLLIAILLFIFLMCAAGRRKGKEEVVLNGIDKIPFDFFLAIMFIIVLLTIAIDNRYYYEDVIRTVMLRGGVVARVIPIFLLTCMSFAVRYKSGGWWENTIFYRLLRYFYRLLCRLASEVKYLVQHISLLWKVILGLILLSMIEFYSIANADPMNAELLIIVWLLEKLIFFPIILYVIISLRKLQLGSEKIASGDLSHRIDTGRLLWDFKRYGEILNNISTGVSRAVEERMKSERFKAELITNVSHDIKTPLTSIINYVDLIKREELEEGTVKEYVTVLDRQSSRLKKLIDDLMDASKASTGNLAVNCTRTEAGVLLTQTIGEYEERMKNCGLELILNQPEEEIFIMADGRLLWRVFDNLMGNICKYSQPGTRVYLRLEQISKNVVITFRNISKHALNISADELLERFVRGDSARTTEGSGLGLSIANSLVELQKGVMDLMIDGDLFKVVLTFQSLS